MTQTIIEIPRDRWKRPLIVPPNGGERVPYTRVSTLAKALDDLNQLMAWKQRKTAEGLVRRPDLLTRVAGALANGDPDPDWPTKRDLNDVCAQAIEAAGASKGSSAGTGFHALTEAIDRVSGPGFVHVSLDLDALDPEIAPGVGTPVKGGLTYREAHLACEDLAESGVVGSLELVEVNPILDRENGSAAIAVELAASALGQSIL